MAFDRRLMRLRALVDRIERLPASARREWMLQEARARIVDVETGAEPRPMRTLAENSPAPPREPPASQVSDDHAVKRPGVEPAPAAASRGRPKPEASPQGASPSAPVPEPPSGIAAPDPSAATLGSDELLWLDDPPGDTVTEQGDGSTEIAPWRRGLRG